MAKANRLDQERGTLQDAKGKLADFAEDLVNLLGTTERKATEWLSQRENVSKQLSAIRDKASSLLQQLGSAAGESPLSWRRRNATGRKRGSKNRQTVAAATATRSPRRRKRKPMSAEARAKIAAAQRARWAKQKKAKNG